MCSQGDGRRFRIVPPLFPGRVIFWQQCLGATQSRLLGNDLDFAPDLAAPARAGLNVALTQELTLSSLTLSWNYSPRLPSNALWRRSSSGRTFDPGRN